MFVYFVGLLHYVWFVYWCLVLGLVFFGDKKWQGQLNRYESQRIRRIVVVVAIPLSPVIVRFIIRVSVGVHMNLIVITQATLAIADCSDKLIFLEFQDGEDKVPQGSQQQCCWRFL